MATMALKDVVICPACGAEMFPSAFDRRERYIKYKCSSQDCASEAQYTFNDVKLEEGKPQTYFRLNDDGDATWKCFTHGYCDVPIESLFDKDYTKFRNCCCIFGRDEDEMEADAAFVEGEGKKIIEKILSLIGAEKASELANDMIDESLLDFFHDNVLDAFCAEATVSDSGAEDYLYQMSDRIFELFDITFDDEWNIE